MEKRLFIAVGVSLLFLWIYSLLAPRLFPELAKPPVKEAALEKPREAPAPALPSAIAAPASSVAPATTAAAPVAEAEIELADREIKTTVETRDYRAVFSNHGAQLVSFRLKGYEEKNGSLVELVRKRTTQGNYPFLVESSEAGFNALANHGLYLVEDQVRDGKGFIEYRARDAQGRVIRKRFEFGEAFRFTFTTEVRGFDGKYRVMVGPGIHEVEAQEESRLLVAGNAIIVQGGDAELVRKEKAPQLAQYASPEWIGIEDNYFLTALQPVRAGSAVLRRIDIPPANPKARPGHEIYAGLNADGPVLSGHAYFGPKEAGALEAWGLQEALHLGWFSPIARMLLVALVWINKYTSNYGWAIIGLTVLIKLLLLPLQHKSMVSMKKMQQVQPKVNALREKFKKAKTDPAQKQKLNEEMMKLYQVEGINPMSGCFPILLQLPILWAFYSLLSNAIELRGAEWIFWIKDLSLKDPYYLTPILMTITMVLQQRLTPTTADPVQARMMMMMPFVFGFIFKDFPSGLVLYWLVQNVLSIIQQIITNRWWKSSPKK